MRRKIGLFTERDGDEALVQDLLDAMAKNEADFTLTFRRLSDAAGNAAGDDQVRDNSPIPQPSTNGPCAGGNGSLTSRNRSRTASRDARRSTRSSSRATTVSKP